MNIVILSGNLTRDPEVRYTPKGQSVVEFSIAVTKRWTTEGGEQKERTSFIGCLIWGKRGEAFAKYHRKGAKALIRGEMVQESWEDKDGKKQSKTRVEVTDWEFATQNKAPEESAGEPATRSEAPRGGGDRGASVPTAPRGSQTPPAAPDEDDVPF